MNKGAAGLLADLVARALTSGTTAAIVEAVAALTPETLRTLTTPTIENADSTPPIARGRPASPGVASGIAAFTSDDAVDLSHRGHSVILIRPQTSPDDMPAMEAAAGIVTLRGGLASHAAIVARGWAMPAIVGAAEAVLSDETLIVGGVTVRTGDEITIDGLTGAIYPLRLEVTTPRVPEELNVVLSWADAICASAPTPVTVMANVDSADGARSAKAKGAQGIGLCRTEHLLLTRGRIRLLRQFLLAQSPEDEMVALDALELSQAADFVDVLDACEGQPVTIRLLDAPLHEFLPEVIEQARLHQTNPMMGTRGVRLGIIRPGIYRMQVRALVRAMATVREQGASPLVEILIPMVTEAGEAALVRSWITEVLTTASLQLDLPIDVVENIAVGTMIETPRAALTASALCQHVDFVSFGTNDLTQTTFGLSRDDVEAELIPAYQRQGLFTHNPFARLDAEGVGQLIEVACGQARQAKPSVSLRACGNHAADPVSAALLISYGVTSLSVAPPDLAVTRLAAAQATLTLDTIDPEALEEQLSTRTRTPAPAPGPEPEPSVDEASVLHALRLRGYLAPSGLEAIFGQLPDEILDRLRRDGLVRFIATRNLLALSSTGQARHQAHLERGVFGNRSDLGCEISGPLWPQLRTLGAEAQAVFSDWRFRHGQPNDHADASYDQSIVIRTEGISEQAAVVIDSMADVLPRLCRYKRRLREAVAAVGDGHDARLTGQMCESFQEVWTEFLDDMELTAGVESLR